MVCTTIIWSGQQHTFAVTHLHNCSNSTVTSFGSNMKEMEFNYIQQYVLFQLKFTSSFQLIYFGFFFFVYRALASWPSFRKICIKSESTYTWLCESSQRVSYTMCFVSSKFISVLFFILLCMSRQIPLYGIWFYVYTLIRLTNPQCTIDSESAIVFCFFFFHQISMVLTFQESIQN